MATALVFVHGINVGPARRAQLADWLQMKLQKYGVDQLFHVLGIGAWRSLGDFFMDLADLAVNDVRRQEAVADIMTEFDRLAELMPENSKLVVWAHSMGQPFAMMAVNRWVRKNPGVKVGVLSLGGPLGNPVPFVQSCLSWAHEASELPDSVLWTDVWNPDDPICCNVLPLPPLPRAVVDHARYRAPARVSHSWRFDFPGKPTLGNPLAEHSSYFEDASVFEKLAQVVKELG